LTRWPRRGSRSARILSALATWFSPARWPASDLLIAVAGLALAISIFVPWFKASIMIMGRPVNGYLIDPPGSVSGIAVHGFLWAIFGLGLLQFVVLALRYAPARRALRVPGDRQILIAASGLSCAGVLVAFAMKPGPWWGGTYVGGGVTDLGGGFTAVVGWSWGAIVGIGAALVSLGLAIAAVRDRPHPERYVI
jgi:hypothetical protein